MYEPLRPWTCLAQWHPRSSYGGLRSKLSSLHDAMRPILIATRCLRNSSYPFLSASSKVCRLRSTNGRAATGSSRRKGSATEDPTLPGKLSALLSLSTTRRGRGFHRPMSIRLATLRRCWRCLPRGHPFYEADHLRSVLVESLPLRIERREIRNALPSLATIEYLLAGS